MKEWKGCQISNDEFWPEHSKIIKICTLIGYFCPKHTMFELKKIADKLCLMALKIGAKFEGKLACAFQNDMNLTKFYSQAEK